MPMEKIKQRLSEVAHHWTVIGMITLFLFGVQPGPSETLALEAKSEKVMAPKLQAKQLKKETLERYSNAVYKPSEMLTDKELKKKIKETYAVYGSIEEIRRIRMENQLKKGWVKAPTT